MKKQIPQNEGFNYAAVVLAFISTILFALVKNRDPTSSTTNERERTITAEDQERILSNVADPNLESDINSEVQTDVMLRPPSIRRTITPGQKRIIVIIVSLVAGIFYGLCFAPVIWIQDNVPNASKEGLDYVFAHYCGILVASTVYFLLYCAIKKNKPSINAAATLPAFVAGIMWAIAQTAFFVANEALMEAVSFPIITRFPGLITAALGVLVYKEIRGKRNLQILALAILITIIGGVLSALSHVNI